MNRRENNPFSTAWVEYPVEQRDTYIRFCQTENPSHSDEAPFPRRVDMWFAAVALASHNGLSPVDVHSRDTIQLIQGHIFGQEPWRIRVLMLLSLGTDHTLDVVENPARMMAIANGLAAAGQPLLVDMLTSGKDRPIWNLSAGLEQLLS